MAKNSSGIFDFGGGVNFNPGASPTPNQKQASLAGVGSGGGTGGGGGYTANNLFPYSGGTSTPGSLTGGTSLYPNLQTGGNNLQGVFGNTIAPYLLNLIKTGGYNPDVFTALVNQLQPQVSQGVATIGANSGASGTRFGSGYELGLSNYLSQVNSNESAMAAGLYENAIGTSLAALGIAAEPAAEVRSNQGGFTQSLITSLIGALGPKLGGLIPGLGGTSIPGIGGNPGTFPSGSSTGSGTNSSDPLAGIDWASITGDISGGYGGMTLPGGPTGFGGGNVSDPFGASMLSNTTGDWTNYFPNYASPSVGLENLGVGSSSGNPYHMSVY